jgi:hypothetical protein
MILRNVGRERVECKNCRTVGLVKPSSSKGDKITMCSGDSTSVNIAGSLIFLL